MFSFTVDPSELKTYAEWAKEHDKHCKFYDDGSSPVPKGGAIGGRLTWSFTPTSLGTITEVSCACGEKCNITDYDMW